MGEQCYYLLVVLDMSANAINIIFDGCSAPVFAECAKDPILHQLSATQSVTRNQQKCILERHLCLRRHY